MNKQELLREAYEAGENDTYVEEKLVESAQLWIEEQDDYDDIQNELVEAYRMGFFGRNRENYYEEVPSSN